MSCINRVEAETETESSSSDALLFATMCIIGLPVDVHIRDGSVFSGIFHTASPEKNYGIVLKEARLTKKGKCDMNVAYGNVVDTLVIQADDLVQVVAKGAELSANGVNANITSNDIEATMARVSISSAEVEEATKSSNLTEDLQEININRDIVENGPREQDPTNHHNDFPSKNNGDEDQSSSHNCEEKCIDQVTQSSNEASYDTAPALVKPDSQYCERPTSVSDSQDAATSSISTAPNRVVDTGMVSLSSSATSTDSALPQVIQSNKKSKEFKLNPGAKVFSPSSANPISATMPVVPAVANMGYVPNNSSILPAVSARPEVVTSNFTPQTSFPTKFSPYSNLAAGNGRSGSQYAQTAQLVGHVSTRVAPVRYAGQYHTVQTAPSYVPPNSQAVMVGRVGQVVFMQPIPQNTAAISPLPAVPLLTPDPVQYLKHLGNGGGQALQMCMPPPLMANGGQQLFPLPNHVPVLPPPSVPADHHIPLPGSSALLGTKFP